MRALLLGALGPGPEDATQRKGSQQMAERVWDRFLTEADRSHLRTVPPRRHRGFGQRVAVLSVDNYRAAIGDRPQPLLEAVVTWPQTTGLAGWAALDRIAELFAVARAVGVPIIHVTGLDETDSGLPGWASVAGLSAARPADRAGPPDPETLARRRRRYDIVDQAAPLPGEVVLRKSAPSAFFGTPLIAHLVAEGIDTLIVCGESVSGCVRATVVDGASYRFSMIVVEECSYDRHETARAINLFDIETKYGEVASLESVMTRLHDGPSRTASNPQRPALRPARK